MSSAGIEGFKSRLRKYRHITEQQNGQQLTVADAPFNTADGEESSRHLARIEGKREPSGPHAHLQKSFRRSPNEDSKARGATRKRRATSHYASPSKYAHLPPLQDVLEHNLICVFVGTNPGIRTATAGHAYAHPSNLFWKLLHSSGCTDTRLRPEQDIDLPKLYRMGNTNIVERPSKDAAELSKAEMAAGTPILEEKFAKYKPEAVCIVGKGIWEAIWRWRYGREIRKDEFRYGWQDEKEKMGSTEGWSGSWVFVASSTSGLSASLRPPEKEAIWKPFGQWVKDRRDEMEANQIAPADEI